MTDSDIQPLPSYWRGTVFRSRTEARWAVFFDAIGLRWEYEPEGFCLADGTWYLPDFWLPEIETWVEVKPSHGPSDVEMDKVVALVNGTRCPMVILAGAPWPRPYRLFYPGSREGNPEIDEWSCSFRDGGLWVGFNEWDAPWDDVASSAMETARGMDLTQPDAGQYLPAGWEGTEVVW